VCVCVCVFATQICATEVGALEVEILRVHALATSFFFYVFCED
jgi:hypothetical protein